MFDRLGSLFFLALIVVALSACTNGGLATILPESDNPSTTESLEKTNLLSSSYVDMSGATRNYEMFKVQYASGDATFMQWVPNSAGTSAGAVLLFMPYGGITWSGEASDAKWTAKGNGVHLDEDGPFYDPTTSSVINFTIVPPTDAAAEGFPYSYNNLHVLVVYGRFHIGGDLQNDIEDVKNGLRFLHSQSLVNKNKIGLTSGSWGGIGVLHAVAQLGASYMPAAIALQYPVSDAKKLREYLYTTVPAGTANNTIRDSYATFFDPYERRIDKATESLAGQSNRYDKYTHASLTGITSDIFLGHDAWDTLVPISHSVDLLSSISSTNKVYYYQLHSTPVDFDNFILNHTQNLDAMSSTAMGMWTYTYLITKLKDSAEAKYSFYDSSELAAQFAYMLGRIPGGNTDFYNDVLKMYCAPNLTLVDADNTYSGLGKDVVKTIMEFYSVGWAADGDAACAKLITHPPF
ncbi:alpha/beta hydrolase family protein [Bdellovibrio sp. HCB2-146]|uniref:alpha/beta hydrolase family protein n=1 Tax=Bdellovibrio sp. HCB2-146 TaxID=3394362 RepID=UPI0039BCA656